MQLAMNVHAERAVLALVFQTSDTNMLWELEELDFGDPANKFLLAELKAMVADGTPLGDPTACTTWFTSPAAKERARSQLGEENLPYLAASVFATEVLTAHCEYYRRLLREERLRRSLQLLCTKLQEKLTSQEPSDVLSWLFETVTSIMDGYLSATTNL